MCVCTCVCVCVCVLVRACVHTCLYSRACTCSDLIWSHCFSVCSCLSFVSLSVFVCLPVCLCLSASFLVFLTVNFQSTPEKYLQALERHQPDKPLMVMEFWTGWFDFWGSARADRILPAKDVAERVGSVLHSGASINLYMFHGQLNYLFYSCVVYLL